LFIEIRLNDEVTLMDFLNFYTFAQSKKSMKFIIPLMFLSTLVFSLGCARETKNKVDQGLDLKKELPGTWESISIKVTINSPDSIPDSTDYLIVEEENWIKVLQIKPIRTYYEIDNKYRSEYRDFRDSIFSITRGIWNVFGDTLLMITPEETYQYQVKIENGLGTFTSFMDWDGDGLQDDEYVGTQRFISKSTENRTDYSSQ